MSFFDGLFGAIDNIWQGEWDDIIPSIESMFEGESGVSATSAFTAAAGAIGQSQTNEAQAQLAAQTSGFNAEQAAANRGFQAEQAQNAMGFSAEQAAINRRFQEDMSSTSWRRAVDDMQRAGLNPMLAFSQGGASSPSGTTASGFAGGGSSAAGVVPSYTSPLSAAVSNAGQLAQVRRVEAETQKIEAETDTERNRPENVRSSTELNNAVAKNILDRLRVMMPEEHAKLVQEIWKDNIHNRYYEESLKADLEKAVQQGKLTKNEARLAELEIPKAVNEARAESTPWKERVAPFLNDAGKVINSAGTVVRRGRR